MSNFYSTYRQNEWGWGRNITDEEVELIKDQVNDFYLNGDSLKNAPFQLKVDVRISIIIILDLNFSSTKVQVLSNETSVFRFKAI